LFCASPGSLNAWKSKGGGIFVAGWGGGGERVSREPILGAGGTPQNMGPTRRDLLCAVLFRKKNWDKNKGKGRLFTPKSPASGKNKKPILPAP